MAAEHELALTALFNEYLAAPATNGPGVVTNSLGVAPVGQVDDQILATDAEFTQGLTEAYESVPWTPI